MIPNRVFIAAFGTALLGVAVYHATQRPFEFGAVLIPALGGLWLVNLAVRISRRGYAGFCGRPGATKSTDAGNA